MSESLPSAEDIANLEKEVKLARDEVQRSQQLLRHKGSVFENKFKKTQIALSLFPVPSDDDNGDEKAKRHAHLILKGRLMQKVESLEVAEEKCRVDEVVKAREEEINCGDIDDCPICLEPIHAGALSRYSYLHCCAKRICRPCGEKYTESVVDIGEWKCPMCRHPYPISKSSLKKMKKKHTDTHPHYQFLAGKEYFDGLNGGKNKSNDKLALKYITKAAGGGDAEAQSMLGFFYEYSPRDIVTKSQSDAMHWYELAAANGHLVSHSTVAWSYVDGSRGESNFDEYFRLMTYSAHHGYPSAQSSMAQSYDNRHSDLPFSLERAKYWMGKLVRNSESDVVMRRICSEAYANYGAVLLQLLTHNMNGIVDVAGHSPVPEALFWFRKASRTKSSSEDKMSETHVELMKLCEKVGSMRCHCCKISSDLYMATKKKEMMKCNRCHWARYCSRECQLRHWDMGHKKDCKMKY